MHSAKLRKWPKIYSEMLKSNMDTQTLRVSIANPTNTLVAPWAIGPYVMYEWPVIQPMSAVHQYTSPGW